MNVVSWPSLADQRTVAEDLFDDHGPQMVADWLAEQIDLVDNLAFARTFSDHIDLPGVAPLDYAHRIIEGKAGRLLGGIRFFRRNVDRPFVDVLAHTFDGIAALCDCVRAEWAIFAPQDIRLRTRPKLLHGTGIRPDTCVHAAPYHRMTQADGRVELRPFHDPDDAIAMVKRRFEHMERANPELRKNVRPANPDDLRAWHERGLLKAIVVQTNIVGLFAAVPGAVGWLAGDEVSEEIIDVPFAGHGYAASAQAEWARTMPADATTYLVGTIDGLNTASRETAQRAGRPIVLDDVFVSLKV